MPAAHFRDNCKPTEGRADRLSWRQRRKEQDSLQKVEVSERLQKMPWLAEVLTVFFSEPSISLLRALNTTGNTNSYKHKMAYQVCRDCDWRLSRALAWREIAKIKSEYLKSARRDVKPLIERARQKAQDAALLMQPQSYGLWLLEQEKELRDIAAGTANPKEKLETIKAVESIRSLYVKLFGDETPLLGPTAKLEHGRTAKAAPEAVTPTAEPLTDDAEQHRLELIAAAVGQHLPIVLQPHRPQGPGTQQRTG